MITFTDRDGTALAVGDEVTAQGIDVGAPGWVHSGQIVGFGRTRVHVVWREASYDLAKMDHHSVATTPVWLVTPGGERRTATALRRRAALPVTESSTTL